MPRSSQPRSGKSKASRPARTQKVQQIQQQKLPQSQPFVPVGPDVVQLLPLGGVGKMGMNAMLLVCGDDAVLLDCGVQFVDSEIPGIDVCIPSLKALAQYKSRLRAIVITHGHEDHIGALPFILRAFPVPVHANRFTATLIQQRLREHGLEDKVELNIYEPGKRLQIGVFDFGFLRVTHSIPDCVSLAIRTPAGNIVFTGDFKIEKGLRDGTVFDEAGFRAFGDEGVQLLMSDSTNSEVPGWSASEASVAIALDDVIKSCKGRIIVSLFASNLYRMHTVVDLARKHGRYTVLMGRSLERYIDACNAATDMPFDRNDFLPVADMDLYDENELCVICTGSQAEERAALGRIANGTHPDLSLKPSDTVILSSRQIPGNEKRIVGMINDIARRGAHVIYGRTRRDIHASGHAYADEQRAVISWLRPKFFFPVHGEYTFLQRHAEMAAELGAKTVLAENGQILEMSKEGIRVRDLVDATPYFAEGQVVGDAETLQIKAREKLAFNGVVAVSARVQIQRGTVTAQVRAQPCGIYEGNGELATEIEQSVTRFLHEVDPHTSAEALTPMLIAQVRRVCKRYTTRKPVVLPLLTLERDRA